MKNRKKIYVGCAMVFTLAVTSVTSLAASAYETPIEAAAGLTGKTVEQVVVQRQAGKSCGAIAAEAGKLEEFQKAVRDIQKDRLDVRVSNGTLTQARADEAIAAMEQRQAVCENAGTGCGGGNGLGNGGYGCGGGNGLGNGGYGRGGGNGLGNGGYGRGMGLQDGSCMYQ